MLPVPLPTGRSLTFLVAGVGTLVAGFALGNQDLVWPALFLMLLPAAMLLAVSLFRPRFTVRRTLDPETVAAGTSAEVGLVVTATRPSVVGSVVAEDDPGSGLGAPRHLRLASSRTGEQTQASYPVQPARRGRYHLDGFRYRFTDLLGFWVHTVRVPSATQLTVTPEVIDLAGSRAQTYGITGETPIPQTAVSGPDDVLVREYQARDDRRRIHWPSTARSGTLMVRREEAAWDPTAWVLLDSRAVAHPEGRGGVHPTFEALVSAAASVGARLLADGFTVTLVDAEASRREVSGEAPGAVGDWLDPLIDADLTGEPDLGAATLTMARASTEHLVVALLGALDLATAEVLAASSVGRQQCQAYVVGDTGTPEAFEAGSAVLIDHGWRVTRFTDIADFRAAWLVGAWGAGR